MKSFVLALALILTAAFLAPTAAEARRIGGGGSSGMQRSLPRTAPIAPPTVPPNRPAVSPSTAPGVAAAAPRRSWLGPIAGIAAGLGIAALMSHFGMGEGLGNIVTLLLVAGLAFVAIRFVMRRFASGASDKASFVNAYAANTGAFPTAAAATHGAYASNGAGVPLASQPTTSTLPVGFDAPAFERTAKLIFIRMQAANDAGDLNDLRAFTTPEMFASVKLDLQDRRNGAQVTDVVQIDAQVLEVVDEGPRQVVSVRFHGLIREETNGPTEPFDEAWHLVKPNDGSREWAIAGIQQVA